MNWFNMRGQSLFVDASGYRGPSKPAGLGWRIF